MATYRVEAIEGIGPAQAKKLAKAGIETTAALLDHCGDRKGRRNTAQLTGISEKLLLKWTNTADLMRVPGIGHEFRVWT